MSKKDKLKLSQSVNWESTPSQQITAVYKKELKLKKESALRASYSHADRMTLDETFNVLKNIELGLRYSSRSKKRPEEKKHFSNMLKSYSTQ